MECTRYNKLIKVGGEKQDLWNVPDTNI